MKGLSRILGARDIKSTHSVGARSIPKVQRSSYLELYMLRREKDRLEKEILALDKQMGRARKQLTSVDKRIEQLQKETHEGQRADPSAGAPSRPFKTMPIHY